MSVKRTALMLSIALCAAGLALAQTQWVDHPANPVLGPGDPGEWDAGGRFPFAMILDGSTWHVYFGGWGTEFPLESNGIGHATSTNGVDWTMDVNNPVLTNGAPGEWDRFFWQPGGSVIRDGGQYHMWYSGIPDLTAVPTRGGHATSPDGWVWQKDVENNPVLDVGPPGSWDDVHARPGGVVIEDQTYKMWYTGFNGSTPQIGYAESTDGAQWTKRPDPVLGAHPYPGLWIISAANPTVVFDGLVYHMWAAGWAPALSDWILGYQFSIDGIDWWTLHRDNPVIATANIDVWNMPVVLDGATWHGWYTVGSDYSSTHYATSECCAGLFVDGFETGDTSAWSATVP